MRVLQILGGFLISLSGIALGLYLLGILTFDGGVKLSFDELSSFLQVENGQHPVVNEATSSTESTESVE